jgi:MerR family mercuric resistance operon transcriptional regulator
MRKNLRVALVEQPAGGHCPIVFQYGRFDEQHRRHRNAMSALATLPIDALAEKSGVDTDTLRTYERLSLLSRPRRPAGGLVLYPADEDGRVTFIKRAFELGFSPDAIRAIVGAGRGRRLDCSDVHAIAKQRLADIRAHIDDLRRMEETLAPLVESCARGSGLVDCSIVNALSHPVKRSQAVTPEG